MTLEERAEAFNRAYGTGKKAASALRIVTEGGRPVIYGIWLPGGFYKNATRFYGAFPATYLERVSALFPDVDPRDTLHAFSGSVPPGPYTRCDMKQPADLNCRVEDLPNVATRRYRLIHADPPYSPEDAKRYGTPGVNRLLCTSALSEVLSKDGHICWLDQVWPMHSKKLIRTAARILIVRSTNHRPRILTIFARADA